MCFLSPKEIIVDMKEMVKDMLIKFYRTNRQAKPERIIFYRDGVSEGQFKQVRLNVCSTRAVGSDGIPMKTLHSVNIGGKLLYHTV